MREWIKGPQEWATAEQLQSLRKLDACVVADAIAALNVRLRNQGYSNRQIRCMFEGPVPMVGYAVTGRMRSAEPPVVGHRFVERSDWFRYVKTIPEPRVAVLQDLDSAPGKGAFWDEIHARIHLRLGCVGAVTNGAVRDLPKIRTTGFSLFAGSVSPAQGYAHIVEVGHPVEIGGLMISSGDLIHGDMHGIIRVPMEVVPELLRIASRIAETRGRVADLCASPDFSIDRVMALLNELE